MDKKNLVEKIKDIFGELSPKDLLDAGYTRVNGPDIGLSIKAGTVYITPNNDGIMVVGNPYPFLTALSENQNAPFKAEETMNVQMGTLRASVYLAEAQVIADCIKYYADVTVREIASHE